MNDTEQNEYPSKTVTIKELAAILGEDYLTTSSIVKFATKIGAMKELPEKRANPAGQRGKPSSLFEVPNEIVLVFWNDSEQAETSEPVNSELVNVEPVKTEPVEPVVPVPVVQESVV